MSQVVAVPAPLLHLNAQCIRAALMLIARGQQLEGIDMLETVATQLEDMRHYPEVPDA